MFSGQIIATCHTEAYGRLSVTAEFLVIYYRMPMHCKKVILRQNVVDNLVD